MNPAAIINASSVAGNVATSGAATAKASGASPSGPSFGQVLSSQVSANSDAQNNSNNNANNNSVNSGVNGSQADTSATSGTTAAKTKSADGKTKQSTDAAAGSTAAASGTAADTSGSAQILALVANVRQTDSNSVSTFATSAAGNDSLVAVGAAGSGAQSALNGTQTDAAMSSGAPLALVASAPANGLAKSMKDAQQTASTLPSTDSTSQLTNATTEAASSSAQSAKSTAQSAKSTAQAINAQLGSANSNGVQNDQAANSGATNPGTTNPGTINATAESASQPVLDLNAGAEKAIQAGLAALDVNAAKVAQTASPAAPATVAAIVPQQMVQNAQVLPGDPGDKLTPQVGSAGWDQALGQKVVWMVAGGQQSASLTLNPPDLGPMQVVLSVTNAHATATFTAAQPEVRQALEAAMPKLREMLGDAGIQLGQTAVNSGSAQQQNAFGGQNSPNLNSNSSQFGNLNESGEALSVAARATPASAGLGLVDTFA